MVFTKEGIEGGRGQGGKRTRREEDDGQNAQKHTEKLYFNATVYLFIEDGTEGQGKAAEFEGGRERFFFYLFIYSFISRPPRK